MFGALAAESPPLLPLLGKGKPGPLLHPLRGIRHPVDIGVGRALEPCATLVLSTGLHQQLRPGVLKPSPGAARRQLGKVRSIEQDQGGVDLTEISTRTCGDKRHLDPCRIIDRPEVDLLEQLQRTSGPTQSTFTVGHHRQVLRSAGHPTHRAQLGDRLGVVPREVRDDTCSLTHRCDSACATASRSHVSACCLHVVLDQRLICRRQVTAHDLGQALREGAELVLNGRIK